MIHTRPECWEKSEALEMLFFFYQLTDELLSENSSDTYALSQHNTMTLLYEIEETLDIIDMYNLYDEHYKSYIIPIIEEFTESIENDYLLKRVLGDRLSRIKTGFEEAKKNHIVLKRWIDLFKQSCSLSKYIELYRKEIDRLVIGTKDKNKLAYCTDNFFASLIFIGYSREYLFTTTRKFFDNRTVPISSISQISEFLKMFDCREKKFEFLVLMNTDILDYIDNLSENIKLNRKIEKVEIADIEAQAAGNVAMRDIIIKYRRLKASESSHEKICIVKYIEESLDPYSAAIDFQKQIRFLQTFTRYFKHHLYTEQIYRFLLKSKGDKYIELKLPKKLRKRPYISQSLIDNRIKNIIASKSMGDEAYYSIVQAIDMHAEAFDAHSVITLFRTFWTALETLFANATRSKTKEGVINSVIHIVQKTYILKLLRQVYYQLTSAVPCDSLDQLGITSFDTFVVYFSSFDENSSEMKKIFTLLSENPLLRARLFELRKSFKDGYSIKEKLDKHQKEIEWQLNRLYRIRNIATHLGRETFGLNIVINHLHNYFDFAVNYMLCKSENNDYIVSTSALVFEAKNYNIIHNEMLKNKEPLSKDNYIKYLFGPDANIINYSFE